MNSSYMINNYGEVFYSIIRAYKPVRLVELGVLHGYSTVHLALALKKNHQQLGVLGHLYSYDLFEEYPFNHGQFEEVLDELKGQDLESYVTLQKRDAFTVHTSYEDNSVELLHVDLSNTADTIRKIMATWDSKMVTGGSIIFEGGTEERDNVEWIKKYNKEPLKPEIDNNQIIKDKYVYATYLKFPGLTHLLKKR